MRVAIIGTGNIGIDLAEKLLREPQIELVAFIGRRIDSPGLQRFNGRIPLLLAGGMESLLPLLPELDVVFDATSAYATISVNGPNARRLLDAARDLPEADPLVVDARIAVVRALTVLAPQVLDDGDGRRAPGSTSADGSPPCHVSALRTARRL